MAGVIDLGAARRQQQLQQMQIMQQFMQHSPLYGTGESNLDRVLKEQSDEDLKQQQLDRLKKESEARITEAQAGTQLKRGQLGLSAYKTQEEVTRGQEKSARDAQELELKKPLWAAQTSSAASEAALHGAQTTEAQARTKSVNVDIQNKGIWANDHLKAGLIEDAKRQINGYTMMAANGQAGNVDPDAVERAYRTYMGDPHITIPRTDDGKWNPDVNQIRGAVLDKDGKPTAAFAKDLAASQNAISPVGKMIQDLRNADDQNWPESYRQPLRDKLLAEVMPHTDQVKGQWLQGLYKASGDKGLLGGLEQIADADAHGKTVGTANAKVPSAREQQDWNLRLDTISKVRDLANQLQPITDAHGYAPTGAGFGPFPFGKSTTIDFLNKAGMISPEVMQYRKDLQKTILDGIFQYTGKRWNPTEASMAMGTLPNFDDPPDVLAATLPKYADMLEHKLGIDAGMAERLGLKVPDGIPKIYPEDVYKQAGRNPAWSSNTGELPSEWTTNFAKSTYKMAQMYEAAKKEIGGTGEFRSPPPPGVPGGPSSAGGSDIQQQQPDMNSDAANAMQYLQSQRVIRP